MAQRTGLNTGSVPWKASRTNCAECTFQCALLLGRRSGSEQVRRTRTRNRTRWPSRRGGSAAGSPMRDMLRVVARMHRHTIQTCMHTYMHACIHACVRTYVHTYLCVRARACVCVHVLGNPCTVQPRIRPLWQLASAPPHTFALISRPPGYSGSSAAEPS